MRSHHSSSEVVRKNPAISHQPPSCSFGKCRPLPGAGGSSASQNSWRRNCDGLQPTDAHMFRPMISNAMNPNSSENTPSVPR